jgi:hypothetical protein
LLQRQRRQLFNVNLSHLLLPPSVSQSDGGKKKQLLEKSEARKRVLI